MQYDVFISYRHADGDAARGVCKLLRAFAQSVFIDDGIAAGAEWAPEIWQALSESRSLIVLWSRSAEKSPYVHEEWTRAPVGCRILALKLDGAAFPPELGRFNAITGLDVAGRLIARSVELMKERRLSPTKAQDQLLQELAADGVVLEEKQKRALIAFLPTLAVVPWWLSSSFATFALAGGAAASSFGIGFWVAPKPTPRPVLAPSLASATPAPAGSPSTVVTTAAPPPCDASARDVSTPAAPICPEAANLADCRKKLTTAEDRALNGEACRKKLASSEAELTLANSKLKACQTAATASLPTRKPSSTTVLRNGPVLELSSAAAPAPSSTASPLR